MDRTVRLETASSGALQHIASSPSNKAPMLRPIPFPGVTNAGLNSERVDQHRQKENSCPDNEWAPMSETGRFGPAFAGKDQLA